MILFEIVNQIATNYSTITAPPVYVPSGGYIPLEIWLIITGAGVICLLLAIFIPRGEIITSLIASVLFGVAAYAALALSIINVRMVSTVTPINMTFVNGTKVVELVSVIQPVNIQINSVWISLLMIGLFLIAALKVIDAINNMFQRAGEEAEEQIGEPGTIETTSAPSMQDVSSGRFLRQNSRQHNNRNNRNK